MIRDSISSATALQQRPRRTRCRALATALAATSAVSGIAVTGATPAHAVDHHVAGARLSAVEAWDPPGTTKLVVTGNTPIDDLVQAMGTDHERNIAYAATYDPYLPILPLPPRSLLRALDATTGVALHEPIHLPIAPAQRVPVMVHAATGDIKILGVSNETELGIDIPGNPNLAVLVTVRKTTAGYATPTWQAWRNLPGNGATLNQSTGDVYVMGGTIESAPGTGTTFQRQAGRVLLIPDADTNQLIDPIVVFDDVTGTDTPNNARGTRLPLLDQAMGRLYLVTPISFNPALAPYNDITVVDVDDFQVLSTNPVAEELVTFAAAVDQTTGRLYISSGAGVVYEYDGRTGSDPLVRRASLTRGGWPLPHVPASGGGVWTVDSQTPSLALATTGPTFAAAGHPVTFATDARPAVITTGPTGVAFAGVTYQTGAGVRGIRRIEQMTTPSVTQQPQSLDIAPGETATFTAAGLGSPTPAIQWQIDEPSLGWTDLVDGDGVIGSQSDTLHITAGDADGQARYRAVFSNDATDWTGAVVPVGAIASQPATLTVGAGSDGGAGSQILVVDVPDAGDGEFVWSVGGDGDVSLSAAIASGDHWSAGGELDPIVVTDTRPSRPSWAISGQVSDFSGLAGSARYLGWTPTVVTEGAGAAEGEPVASGFLSGIGLAVSSTLASAAPGHETGSASVGASLDLRLPIATPPDTYTAVLTITAVG